MTEANREIKRTALYELHLEAGARMVEFSGWKMPVQYSGIVAEHRKVREAAGVFDVSHMGRLLMAGKDAGEFLHLLATNDVLALAPGQVLYTLICNREGGVRDDVLISRLGEQEYLVVPNASNREKILTWIEELLAGFKDGAADLSIQDRTAETVMVAVQGPDALELLRPHTDVALDDLKYFRIARGRVLGVEGTVSRTGYTGEDGFEVIVPAETGVRLWREFMAGAASGKLALAGLGARDTLRLEAALPLYGNELEEDINPLEVGLGRFVKLAKSDFVGKEVLAIVAEAGPARRLIGLEVPGGAIARHGTVVEAEGRQVGQVSSGTFSPTLDRSIAMAFVAAETADSQNPLSVVVRGNTHPSYRADLPFFHRGKRK